MTEHTQETFSTSPTIEHIAPALLEAQKAMGVVFKDADNPFYGSKFAELAEVMGVCKKPYNDNGIAILQPVSTGEKGVVVTTLFLHTSGEWLSSSVYFPAGKMDSQEYGKCVSYARRYSLQSFAFIPAVDNDMGDGSGTQSPRPFPVQQTWDKTKREEKALEAATPEIIDFFAYAADEDRVGQITAAKKFMPKTEGKKASWGISIATKDADFNGKLWDQVDFDWESWIGKTVWYRVREGEWNGKLQYTLQALQEYDGSAGDL